MEFREKWTLSARVADSWLQSHNMPQIALSEVIIINPYREAAL